MSSNNKKKALKRFFTKLGKLCLLVLVWIVTLAIIFGSLAWGGYTLFAGPAEDGLIQLASWGLTIWVALPIALICTAILGWIMGGFFDSAGGCLVTILLIIWELCLLFTLRASSIFIIIVGLICVFFVTLLMHDYRDYKW